MRWWVSLTDWNKIREEFETTDISMKDLAEKYDVKYATLRSRKSREQWGKDDATQQEMQRNKKERVATEKIVEQLNDNDELKDKHKHFCLLYLKYFNATKAYQEVYGCSYATAATNGSRLLRNAHIKEELERLKKEQRAELYVDSLDIKREWLKQAFVDVTDFIDFGQEEYTVTDEITGEQEKRIRSFVRLKDDSEVDGSLIQEVKQGRDGVSVKLYDKQKALEKIEQFLSDSGSSEEDKVIIVNNLNDDRMKEWVDDNGGL